MKNTNRMTHRYRGFSSIYKSVPRSALKGCMIGMIFILLMLSEVMEEVCASETKGQGPDFATLVHSPKWEDRDLAAYTIFSNADLDTIEIISLVIEGIKTEVSDPSSSLMPVGSYLTHSERILRKYIIDLQEIGPTWSPVLRDYYSRLTGDARIWIAIALGCQEDSSVHHILTDIIFSSSDCNMKAMSIKALSTYSDTNDIHTYEKALLDTCSVIINNDVSVDGTTFHEMYYPVRAEAITALKRLGCLVRPDSTGGYIFERQE